MTDLTDCISRVPSYLLVIIVPRHIFWCPLELVNVPIILRISDVLRESFVFLLHILIDDVGAIGTVRVRWNKFESVNLAPAFVRPCLMLISFPEGEERRASSFLVISLDSGSEPSVPVSLMGHNLA